MTDEEVKAYRAKYYVEHRAAIRIQQKQYAEVHRADKAAYDVAYGELHHGERLARERERYQRKRVQILRYQRDYYLTHKEKVGKRVVDWREDHSENVRITSEKRRLRKNANTPADEMLTLGQWCDILDQYHHRCAYCGVKSDHLTMDHVIPLARGGKHSKDNIVPACQHCNSSKKDKTPKERFGMETP